MSEPSSRLKKTLATLRGVRPTILPSLLLCDFANLEREVRMLEEAGVECLHLDVMDGSFVPNMSYGMPIVSALRKVTDLMLDVHLMIRDPNAYALQFVEAGADLVTFHIEALGQPSALLDSIRSQGVAAGLAINPSTEMSHVLPFVGECDMVLVMSVEAGFGGQAFNPIALERLSDLRKTHGPDLLLEVDGGVNENTVGPMYGQWSRPARRGFGTLSPGGLLPGDDSIASGNAELKLCKPIPSYRCLSGKFVYV